MVPELITEQPEVRRVLMALNGSLVDEGIFALVKTATGCEFASTRLQSEDALIHSMTDTHPDVVVFGQHGIIQPDRLIQLLEHSRGFEQYCLVVYDPEENDIEIYSRKNHQITGSERFISILMGNEIPR